MDSTVKFVFKRSNRFNEMCNMVLEVYAKEKNSFIGFYFLRNRDFVLETEHLFTKYTLCMLYHICIKP